MFRVREINIKYKNKYDYKINMFFFFLCEPCVLSILIGTLWEKIIKNKEKKPTPSISNQSNSLLSIHIYHELYLPFVSLD